MGDRTGAYVPKHTVIVDMHCSPLMWPLLGNDSSDCIRGVAAGDG